VQRLTNPVVLAGHCADHDHQPHEGVRLSTLREIVAELDARREIALKYEIERYRQTGRD
jgi:hypothetical protein